LIYLLAEAPLSPMSNSVTISQIAETAGVSTATVDRVINGRSGVNPLTVRKVKEALVALGGAPPMRGRPRSTPNYRFAFVLPAARLGFFDLVDRVIAQNAGEFRHQHVTEVTLRLPSHDFNAFAEELAKLTDYGGLAVLAPDVPAVKLAINELVAAGVHVISMFSDVAGSMRKAFLGTDNRGRPNCSSAAGPIRVAPARGTLHALFLGHPLCSGDRPSHWICPGDGGAVSEHSSNTLH
jgi:LacI family transcriptional regulator